MIKTVQILETKSDFMNSIRECAERVFTGYTKVFLFGSHANTTEITRSDFDIGVLLNSPDSTTEISNFRELLDELPTLHQFDVVDFKYVTESFRNSAMSNIEWIIQ